MLGVERSDGSYLGVLRGDTVVLPYDTLIAYGRIAAIQRLDERTRDLRGALQHTDAIVEQIKVAEHELAEDAKRIPALAASIHEEQR